MKLDLPNGAWAEIREPDQIPRKQARAYRHVLYSLAVPTTNGSEPTLPASDQLVTLEDMTEALVFAVVSSWSFGEVTPEALDTVPDAAIEAIYDKAVTGGYVEKLTPDFSPTPNEDSPTGPSSA